MGRATEEETIQFMVSAKVKRALKKKAFDRDETMRTFILKALRDAGLSVPEDELTDRRRGGRR